MNKEYWNVYLMYNMNVYLIFAINCDFYYIIPCSLRHILLYCKPRLFIHVYIKGIGFEQQDENWHIGSRFSHLSGNEMLVHGHAIYDERKRPLCK